MLVDLENIGILSTKKRVGYILKQYPSDFIVYELYNDGLDSEDKQDMDLNVLNRFFDESTLKKITDMDCSANERDKKELLAEIDIPEKADRTLLHKELKHNPLLVSEYKDKKFKVFKSTEKGIFSFIICKINEDTVEACMRISKELGVPSGNVRFAGNKDRKAVVYQRISVDGVYYDSIRHFSRVRREREHLKLGCFKYNKFVITLRPIEGPLEKDVYSLDEILENFDENKISIMPNFFGTQRFGRNFDNHTIGKLMVEKKFKEAVDLIMCTKENDGDYVKEAKKSFWNKEYSKSYMLFPRNCISERSICKNIEKGYKHAVYSIKRAIRTLYLHAYQSYKFNIELSKLLNTKYTGDEYIVLENSSIKRKAFFKPKSFDIKKKNNAYIFTFILEPSTYATILLREILGDAAQ